MNIALRAAIEDDMKQIFEWRNMRELVEQSETGEAVTWDDHQVWFPKALKDENKIMLIITVDGQDVGPVRFDRDGKDGAPVVSIHVAGEYKGKGIGRQALDLAMAEVKNRWKPDRLLARIRRNNEVSLRLFAAAGFAHAHDEGEIAVYQYEYAS